MLTSQNSDGSVSYTPTPPLGSCFQNKQKAYRHCERFTLTCHSETRPFSTGCVSKPYTSDNSQATQNRPRHFINEERLETLHALSGGNRYLVT